MLNLIWMIFLGLFVIGCASAPTQGAKHGGINKAATADKDAVAALKMVAESLSGKDLSDQDLKAISQDLKKDKQSQLAVESITGAISANHLVVHYCPVDGERFSRRVKVCPIHHVELKEVEER